MTFHFRQRTLTLRQGDPMLMGILNVTPDSFSDGGRYDQCEAAVAHAQEMIAQGAGIIDIGGESTRPGHQSIPDTEEIKRILPVIKELRKISEIPLSVDTSKATVAAAALEAGADIVNDVSALADSAMPEVISRYQAGCVLMHYQKLAEDANAPEVVTEWLKERLEEAQRLCRLPREYFLVDPGIGFGKSVRQNLALIAHLETLNALPAPLLLAMSRKSFIGAVAGVANPAERLPGTLAAATLAWQHCHLLRVHDVAPVRQAIAVAQALTRIREFA